MLTANIFLISCNVSVRLLQVFRDALLQIQCDTYMPVLGPLPSDPWLAALSSAQSDSRADLCRCPCEHTLSKEHWTVYFGVRQSGEENTLFSRSLSACVALLAKMKSSLWLQLWPDSVPELPSGGCCPTRLLSHSLLAN